MKRATQHPEPSARAESGPRYWRSLDELAATPGFRAAMEREFPEGASELAGVDRRQFMKIMAASFALGGLGLSGCRRPEENILPFGKSVEGAVPGLPVYYATAMPLRRGAIPLLAETHQGRPTKLEGNPTYAPLGGATSLFAQASILELYDPDRATAHTRGGGRIDSAAVKALLAGIGKAHAADRGAGLAFLADESSSHTRSLLVRYVRGRFPRAYSSKSFASSSGNLFFQWSSGGTSSALLKPLLTLMDLTIFRFLLYTCVRPASSISIPVAAEIKCG